MGSGLFTVLGFAALDEKKNILFHRTTKLAEIPLSRV